MVPDAAGGLYLVGLNRVLHLPEGGSPRPHAEAGSPAGAAALGPQGTLFLGRGDRVLRVGPDGEVEVVAEGFEQVYGVAADGQGTLFVTDWETGRVYRLEGGRRTVLAEGLEHPSGVLVDPGGYVFVKESGRQTHVDMRVQRISPDGTVELFATVPSVSRHR